MSRLHALTGFLALILVGMAGCANTAQTPSPPAKLITGAQIKDLCPVTSTPVCTSKMNATPKCSCQGKEELQRLLEDY